MAKDKKDSGSTVELLKSFNSAAVLQDKEVAALMGNGLESGDGQILPGGLISKYGYLEGKDSSTKKKKKDKWFQEMILRIMIRNSIRRLQEIIEYHRLQMETLAEKMDAIQNQLNELIEEEKTLREVLENYRDEGAFELAGPGRLKNEIVEMSLQKWEAQAGQKLDRSGIKTYMAMLKILEDNEAQQLAIESDLGQTEIDYNFHKKQKDEAQEILNDLESGDHERCQNALHRIDTMSFEQEVELALNIHEQSEPNKIEGQEKGLSKEDAGWDAFSFGFPPPKGIWNCLDW